MRGRRVDAVAFDYTLLGALFAAERTGIPAAMLVHTVYPFPTEGLPPFGMGWTPKPGATGRTRDRIGRWLFRRIYERPLVPRLNEVRAQVGLTAIGSLGDVVARANRVLVLTSRAFDFPATLPGNVRYVGAQLEDPEWTPEWVPPWPPGDDRPIVAVGLSTTYQAHRPLLDRSIEALGSLPVKALVSTGPIAIGSTPANVHASSYMPHSRVFPFADVVVTHGGLGTVHAALAHGKPLVCAPLGRDQPDNAARVVSRGAGVRVGAGSSARTIAAAVTRVLGDPEYAMAARRLGETITRDDPATGVDELLRVAGADVASRSEIGATPG
jgi:UDP:flavonoid glycosyltransferase YjiC (YdhE family)